MYIYIYISLPLTKISVCGLRPRYCRESAVCTSQAANWDFRVGGANSECSDVLRSRNSTFNFQNHLFCCRLPVISI